VRKPWARKLVCCRVFLPSAFPSSVTTPESLSSRGDPPGAFTNHNQQLFPICLATSFIGLDQSTDWIKDISCGTELLDGARIGCFASQAPLS